jgi:hypothetical protein
MLCLLLLLIKIRVLWALELLVNLIHYVLSGVVVYCVSLLLRFIFINVDWFWKHRISDSFLLQLCNFSVMAFEFKHVQLELLKWGQIQKRVVIFCSHKLRNYSLSSVKIRIAPILLNKRACWRSIFVYLMILTVRFVRSFSWTGLLAYLNFLLRWLFCNHPNPFFKLLGWNRGTFLLNSFILFFADESLCWLLRHYLDVYFLTTVKL